MKSRRTCTQQNDSTSSVSLANRLYDEKRSTLAPRVAKCCFGTRAERVGSSVNTTTSALQNDTSAGRRPRCSPRIPANGPSACQCWSVRCARSAPPERREQRCQTPHTVGDGALGKIHARADPPAAGTSVGTADTCRSAPSPIPRCPGCPSESAVPARRREQPRCRRALATAAVAPPLDHPPVGAHLDLQLLAVLTAVRAILVAAGRAAAPLRLNVVCFDLHRQVCVPAPAMACRPGLRPRRRGAAAASVPPKLLVRFSLPRRRTHRSRRRCRNSLASHAPLAVSLSAAALALPPCRAFCGNSAPAGAVPIPRAAAPPAPSGTPPCSHSHSARTLPHLISYHTGVSSPGPNIYPVVGAIVYA